MLNGLNRLFKHGFLFSLILLLLATITGCWSRKELDHLGLVVVIGIDKEKNGEYRLELKIVKPGLVAGASAGGAGGGGGGGTAGQPFWIAQATGKTLPEAMARLQAYTPRRPFLAHSQAVVVGEEVAREGLGPVLDFLTRHREVRRTTYLFVTRQKASDILEVSSPLEPTPGLDIAELLAWTRYYPRILPTTLNSFLRALSLPWLEPVAGVAELVTPAPQGEKEEKRPEREQEKGKEKNLQVAGTALFRGDRLVGYLTPEETETFSWLMGGRMGGVLTVTMPKGRGGVQQAAIRLMTTRSRIRADDSGGVVIRVDQEGSPAEQAIGFPMDLATIKKIEKMAATAAAFRLASLMKKLQQEYRVDSLGLGRVLYRTNPTAWRKIGQNWEENYPELRVRIETTFRLRNVGMTVQPPR